jgi:hypothetical protein
MYSGLRRRYVLIRRIIVKRIEENRNKSNNSLHGIDGAGLVAVQIFSWENPKVYCSD